MKCRIDKSKCKIFLDLGKMPVANGFINKANNQKEYFYKLNAHLIKT